MAWEGMGGEFLGGEFLGWEFLGGEFLGGEFLERYKVRKLASLGIMGGLTTATLKPFEHLGNMVPERFQRGFRTTYIYI